MKLKNLVPKIISERSDVSYAYGCVMLYFSFDELTEIQSLIKTKDVYIDPEDDSFGLEDEPHTTLLFGLHEEVTKEQVEGVLDKFTYSTCKVFNPSIFEGKLYDVLKFEVRGDYLQETHDELKKFPHTLTHPKYNPHLTIGYITKGRGQYYADLLKKHKFNEYWLAPQYAVYSTPNNGKHKINIKID
jgi:hypothetical protein